MIGLAVAAMLASAGVAYAVGAAFVASRDSLLRSKRGVLWLFVLVVTFVPLPPQLTAMGAAADAVGGLLPGLAWPAGIDKAAYLVAWGVTSVAALLVGARIWRAGSTDWRPGAAASDASGASRINSLLPLADTLPDAIEVVARARVNEREAARAATSIREAGRRLANALPPSNGALYSMVAAELPPAVAALVTGFLLDGAGRRGSGGAAPQA